MVLYLVYFHLYGGYICNYIILKKISLLFIVIRDSDGISASPFLNKILIGLEDGNAGFLCVGIFALFCIYLLWCT